ncbi:hypothetical protein IGI41_000379 [Enterococcus sp. DIV0876]
MLSIPFGQQFVWLSKETLSKKELLLLQLRDADTQRIIDPRAHPWYSILFEHQPISDNAAYRFLHVHFSKSIDNLQSEWLAEIQQMLPSVVDLFFTYDNQAVIIEQHTGENLRVEDLDGLFVALDMDFDCYSQLFVGPFHRSAHDFTNLWQEESTFYQEVLRMRPQQKSLDLPKALVTLFISGANPYLSLLRTLYLDWFEEETETIIRSLWHNQGNASSTAKALFMHRNSLLYKIDKFQTATNLNLKVMDDLLLCYFLCQTFSTNTD